MSNPTADLFDPPIRALEHDARLFKARDAAIIRKANPIEPTARRSDIETSHEAAREAAKRAPITRILALKILAAHPEGLTDFELERLSGVGQTSIGKRRGDLVKLGLVRMSRDYLGRIKKRPSPTGCNATVWELA